MKIGIIGGSGLYAMEGVEDLAEIRLSTPFGEPSDAFVSGRYQGREIVFLPRHARGHRLLPSEIPFKANVWGMKRLGATHLISVSAVGSLKEHIAPGDIVYPDQFIDRTYLRDGTFFGRSIVAHVQFGDPVCPRLVQTLHESTAALGIPCHRGGTYVCIEGPAFSTRAESNLYRSWGGAVIGMTNLQEAKLAREAELCFATIALATDYDCWHQSEEEVNVESVLKVMAANVANTKRILGQAIAAVPEARTCGCGDALRNAILTPLDRIPPQVRRDLDPVIGRYLPKS
jgi:5'-methylthioadenosine phosphorylase